MKNALLLLTLFILSLTSCATLFTGTRSSVQINSYPPGAKILVDGIDRGHTPSSVKLKKGNDGQLITLKLDGYDTKSFSPETSFNTITILNLANLLFWGIDLISGAAWKYSPKYYEIELEKSKKN